MSGVILNSDEIAADIAAAIQGGISTAAAPILYDSVTRVRSTIVTCNGSNQELFAANAARRGFIFQNRSSTEVVKLEFGGEVSDTESIEIDPQGGYFMEAQERDLRSINVKGPNGTPIRAVQILAI